MKFTNYNQVIKYLESFIGKVFFKLDPQFLKQHDPLERMRVLLSLLGNPQNKFKSVLVGGTSGKGSTAYLLSHILTTAGYKTGLTISPHLQKINERIQINDQQISNDKFVELLKSSILPSIRQMSKMRIGEPSYFEILVAMAFVYFSKEKVDIAVVEVGMGGEFDATNTLFPLIAVLTNVSLDHTNVLGNTVEKIAKTKSGIIKSDKKQAINNKKNELIVITGVKQTAVVKIVEERTKKVGAELLRLGKDFNLTNYKVSLLGDYQVENASLAIETVRQLADFGFKISEQSIKKALQTAFFPGRFEIVHVAARGPVSRFTSASAPLTVRAVGHLLSRTTPRNSSLILDGAHNPAKMQAFLGSLRKIFPKEKKVFVVAFKEDKDAKAMLRKITPLADKIIITKFHAKTDMKKNASADAVKIKSQILNLKYKGKVFVKENSKKALEKGLVIQQFNNKTIIVVTGSLYLVGEVRSML